MDRSWQTTYKGKPQGKTVNDKGITQLSNEGSDQ
jgi:hypothetical protein